MDIYLPASGACPGMVIEIKLHQRTPSGKNQPRTQKAGQVFGDLFRLARFTLSDDGPRRYFVYVTDGEMAGYFTNPSNGFNRFFDLAPDECLTIDSDDIRRRADTFVKALGVPIADGCRVTGCLRERIADGWLLRVYEVS